MFRDCRIDLSTVTTITENPTQITAKVLAKYDATKLLSIHYNENEELTLIFDNINMKKEWWYGL